MDIGEGLYTPAPTPAPSPTSTAARKIMRSAHEVTIDQAAVDRTAAAMHANIASPQQWGFPYLSTPASSASSVITTTLLNAALQYSFWPDSGPRWQVDGKQGSFGITVAIRRAYDAGVPIDDPTWLATCSNAELQAVFIGDSCGPNLPPLWNERVEMVHELGRWFLANGGAVAALHPQRGARDAYGLADRLATDLTAFADTAQINGIEIRFNKKAQLGVSLLKDLLGPQAPSTIQDQRRLTVFADYRVPQILRHLGILSYSSALEHTIDTGGIISPGSPEEVEIRTATIAATDRIVIALRRLGVANANAAIVDAALWRLAQAERDNLKPFHLCRTVAY